jgi:hypothetical protein
LFIVILQSGWSLNVKHAVIWTAGFVGLLMTLVVTLPTAEKSPEGLPTTRLAEAPQAIYSTNPNECWNRIFYYLFSRRVNARLSAEFPEGAPFRKTDGLFGSERHQVSTRTFERTETGDRAIDPLYPSFLSDKGARLVLSDPAYADYRKALEEALQEYTQRSAMARAVMQSDLWSAYDSFRKFKFHIQIQENALAERRLAVLGLLGQLIRKIALTPEEIHSLPENYSAARKTFALPDLFGSNSGWVEVRWFPVRLHDESAGFRRVSRVFLKPARPPQDMQTFLNDFRREEKNFAAVLDGVALVIQPLVIDAQGQMTPTGVSTDVQFRLFEKTTEGAFQKTRIGVYEVSRKRLLSQPESGGMVEEADSEPAYLPSAGNDYSFASPQWNDRGRLAPLVVSQRTRCASCHGSRDLTNVMTFSMIVFPQDSPGPEVRELDPLGHESADFVMSQKVQDAGWQTLRQYFDK